MKTKLKWLYGIVLMLAIFVLRANGQPLIGSPWTRTGNQDTARQALKAAYTNGVGTLTGLGFLREDGAYVLGTETMWGTNALLGGMTNLFGWIIDVDGNLIVPDLGGGVSIGDVNNIVAASGATNILHTNGIAEGGLTVTYARSNNSVATLGGAVLSGSQNSIGTNNPYSVIAGGRGNSIPEYDSIGSGWNVIGGGLFNAVNASEYASVGGGQQNLASSGTGNTIAGGMWNTNNGLVPTIGGGRTNVADGTATTVSGGQNNRISGDAVEWATIGGGRDNLISGDGQYAAIPGGQGNNVTVNNAFAIGNYITNSDPFTVAIGYSNRAARVNSVGTLGAHLIRSTNDVYIGDFRLNPAASDGRLAILRASDSLALVYISTNGGLQASLFGPAGTAGGALTWDGDEQQIVAVSGWTFRGDNTTYGVSWNGSTKVPDQNTIYDKIESLSGGGNAYTNAATQVFDGQQKLTATSSLSLSNATASRMAMIGVDKTVTNASASSAASPINRDGTASTSAQIGGLFTGGLDYLKADGTTGSGGGGGDSFFGTNAANGTFTNIPTSTLELNNQSGLKIFDSVQDPKFYTIGGNIAAVNTGADTVTFGFGSEITLEGDGDATFTATTTIGAIVGTVAADNAPAGTLGEYVESKVASGSAVSLTTATAANITSISLTAGDWDVEGNVNIAGATATYSQGVGGISTTSATLPTDGTEVNSGAQFTLLSVTDGVTITRKRINVNATTTVYLVGKATFSAGTMTGYGSINARRVR